MKRALVLRLAPTLLAVCALTVCSALRACEKMVYGASAPYAAIFDLATHALARRDAGVLR